MIGQCESLAGKVVVVTGGSAGIGLGIVTVLARRGATVISADRNAPVITTDGKIESVLTDVSDPASIRQLFDHIAATYGGLDGLVNNAGVTIQGDFLEFDPEHLETLWATNLRSVFLCTQHAGRMMRAHGKGAIVNIASNHASSSVPGYEMYAATKGGIVSMTRAMAWSLGPHGIRVNSLSPGLTRTEALQSYIEQVPGIAEQYARWHATGRYNAPADVGEIATFLLSDAAIGITGADILADNGMSSILFHETGQKNHENR